MSTKGKGRGKKAVPATGATTIETDNIVDSTTEMPDAGKMESIIGNGKKGTKRKHVEQSAGKSNDIEIIESNGATNKIEKNKKKGAPQTLVKKNKGGKKVVEVVSDEGEDVEEDVPEPEPVKDIPQETEKLVKGKRGRPAKAKATTKKEVTENGLNGKEKKNKGVKKVVEVESDEGEEYIPEPESEPEPEPVKEIPQEIEKLGKGKRGRPAKAKKEVAENGLNGKEKKTVKTAAAKKIVATGRRGAGKRGEPPVDEIEEEGDENYNEDYTNYDGMKDVGSTITTK